MGVVAPGEKNISLKEFKYLGTDLTNQNCIQEEINLLKPTVYMKIQQV